MEPPRRTGYGRGVRVAWPLAVVVGLFGIPFGILARDAGMGALAPVLMSATTFAGSAQFAAVSVLGSSGALAAAVIAAALLNARYVPIGVSVAQDLPGSWPKRLLLGQLVVDESWAVSARGDGRFDRHVLVAAGLLLYMAWVGGTALGVLGATVLPDPETLGLDGAFPALFLSLLAPHVRSRPALAAAVGGAAIALFLIPLTPAGVPIVAASVMAILG
ncbi:MAG TPA: AzlC family ABC transporter permease, partial [Actinomycetota bacterium]|nr:AzlC family ABC transporter permease [Actinomycetota bacterium]